MIDISTEASDAFIAKWSGVTASELSTAQSFALDLCRLLGVEPPHPDAERQYMFERPITFVHGDGSSSAGRIDLYKRGCFVLEAKKLKAPTHTKGFDDALLRARSQAEQYARALPANEGRPPFLIVLDVGNRIELYAEFSRSGATYTPFPDPRSHRIALTDLRDEAIRTRLRAIWTDPLTLDPSRESARVTREIAARLATLARSLEQAGHHAEAVAQFLMRCLFTMFAEDVKLLPPESFRDLLIKYADQPEVAMRMLAQLWRDMDGGGFSAAIACDVLKFNGKLFKQPDTLPLTREQVALLIEAAKAKWEHVEPAIFGTLLERALDPIERHKLGAHYTPRAYVERLVLPTVIEPLRVEWSDAHAAALTLAVEGKADEAVSTVRAFHHRLCTVRVLDPACGSGNFLYVTLEHLKRLEGEVLNALDELGFRQTGLALGQERADAMAGETVDPHQLLGIELNPRAAAIAEVVLWIGYLQWHFRTRGDVSPPQPVIRDFRNIENRDAVLAYDRMEYVLDERGVAVSRWDGLTMKKSPITGEDVPDDRARLPLERYVNPRKAAWPQADFVVGNPPYLGARTIRASLGDGYLEAIRGVYHEVPDNVDFVMYWWDRCADLVNAGALQCFGLITTNSIRQEFSRKVLNKHFAANAKFGVRFCIPDHPWVDSSDGAAVRVALTTADASGATGSLGIVEGEATGQDGEVVVTLRYSQGLITPSLNAGHDLAACPSLLGNSQLSCVGYQLTGKGFVVEEATARNLDAGFMRGSRLIRPLVSGRDIVQSPRGLYAIDLFGLSVDELREQQPALYQWALTRIKPEREHNPRQSLKDRWWIFGEARSTFRPALAGINRAITTSLTAKYRTFVFVEAQAICDSTTVMFAIDDGAWFGVLSSSIHGTWAMAAGGRLGVGNDSRYSKGRCFEPFPFPAASEEQQVCLRALAEQLDAQRKRQQAAHPDLTLTGMYNVLEKLRGGEPLTAKERTIHEHGLVSVLRQLHDEIDAAVLDAYGWNDLLPLLRVAMGMDARVARAQERPMGNGAPLPSPLGRRAGDEGDVRQRLPKAPLPDTVRDFARQLRRDRTTAEELLWHLLRDRRLHDAKFRRQHPQPPYTLDFYCHDLRLAVELDGSQHMDSRRDARRDAALATAGIEVLRYWNHDLLARTEQVLEDLWWRVEERSRNLGNEARAPSPPTPLPLGEGSQTEAKRAFDAAILERLVALNAERAAEEARGLVRWLRPEFQHPVGQAVPTQTELPDERNDETASVIQEVAAKPQPWPKDAVAQVRAVADALVASPIALSVDDLAARFTARGPWKKRLPQLLDMLVALGRAREHRGLYSNK